MSKKTKKHGKPKLLIANIYFWMAFCIMMDIGTCAIKDFNTAPNPILFSKKIDMGAPFILCTSTDIYPGGFHITPETLDSMETFIPYYGTLQDALAEFVDFTIYYTGPMNVLQMFSGKSKEHVRDYREASAPADKSQFLNHITIVAHIANGIHLQSGLMNGKIPVDDLIKELLNLGAVKVSDIASFKPDKITALTAKLKETLSSLVDSTKLEKEAIKWNKLRIDSESVGDVTKIPDTKEYIKEIEQFEKSILQDISAVGAELKSLEETLDDLGQYASSGLSTSTDKTQFLNQIKYATSSSKELVTVKSSFDAASKKLEKFNQLKTGPNVFKPFETLMNLAVDRGTAPSVDPNELVPIKKNIQQILDVATFLEGSRQDIKNINELVRRRILSEPKTGVYTSGLPGGIADLKQLEDDVRDPWIEKVISVQGSNLNGLSDGLQPLFKANYKLSRINEKLKTFVSTTLFESLSDFNELQDSISMLKQDSLDSVDVLQKYFGCATRPPSLDTHKDSKKLIEYVQSMADIVTNANELSKVEITMKNDLDSFIKKIDSIQDIHAKAKHLKESNDLADMKARVLEVKKVFDVIDAEKIKNEAIPFIKTADTILKKQDFQGSLKTEKDVYNCLQKLAVKAETLSRTTQAIQNLRDFDSKQFNDIELATNTISQISKDLSETKTIPDTMKKEAKDATTEINKMPNPSENSKAIGQSASSLQYAFGLKDFDVSSLKNVGPIAKSEIQMILSPSDKTTVEGEWGDHKKQMAELEATVASIKSFETKLDISKAKTISEYGAPLVDLATIPSTIINAKDKLNALDALISKADPKNKDALEVAKKDLITVSSFDLDFSSRSSQFKSAPAAFKTFDDFLSGFLAVEHNQTQVINEGTSTNTIFIIVGVFVLILLIVGIVFGIRWYKNRKEAKPKREATKKNVESWISDRRFKEDNSLDKIMRFTFQEMGSDSARSGKLRELDKQSFAAGEAEVGNGVGEGRDGKGSDGEDMVENALRLLAEHFAIDRDQLLVYILKNRLESRIGTVPPVHEDHIV
ncbi:hypothetical protein CAEBREN_16053 [Caenorhabditis brenneri]|uniref:Domain of unknown function WSN domain-containing protein n=1 Tax=Caenorhabditis brenneri TaxID=135651 RepID=G0MZT4_CAEBE|nr:hypothetical protein CAEBREN_16053 [Caenorhabditis brenneri]